MQLISLAAEGALARLRIENPPLNILTSEIRTALLDRIVELEDRSELRVVIIEGCGDQAFSAGSDVREFPSTIRGGLEKITFEQFVLNRLAALPQPTIAKLKGHVLGGGGELMLACDFRLAAETATFGFPEIRLGALPAAGGMKRLVRDVGSLRARDLVMRGHTITAQEAAATGLIGASVPENRLDAEVDRLATQLIALPADALRLAKRCIEAASSGMNVDTFEAESFAELYRGSNLGEGLRAFREKRPPRFNR